MKLSKLNQQQRSRIGKWALYGLIVFIAYVAADLLIINYRDKLLPNQAPPKKATQTATGHSVDRTQYSVISSRNLFSSTGQIPDPLKSEEQEQTKKDDTPVQTNLPINLIGTLVHTNPAKSVAAIEVKSKNMTGSYIPGAEIEGLAKLEKVERNIIYIRNLNNGAIEFAEMNKGNSKVSFDASKAVTTAPTQAAGKEIQNLGNNTFAIKRADLNKYLNDLSSLLMQARALPNRDPNTGEINGYRLVDYQPGSIFEQLSIPRGALIKSAGGTPVTSIQAAMEMFNGMKNSNQVKIGLEINGSDQTYTYDIQGK